MISETPSVSKIEARFKTSIDRYVNERIPPGSFIRFCLENDLSGAIGHADMEALNNIRHIVCYIYNEIPGYSWGSKEKVKSYLANK